MRDDTRRKPRRPPPRRCRRCKTGTEAGTSCVCATPSDRSAIVALDTAAPAIGCAPADDARIRHMSKFTAAGMHGLIDRYVTVPFPARRATTCRLASHKAADMTTVPAELRANGRRINARCHRPGTGWAAASTCSTKVQSANTGAEYRPAERPADRCRYIFAV